MSKPGRLHGHALRNANLRRRSLDRARGAPALARAVVRIRAGCLGLTRMELARLSHLSRGTLRDLELGVHTPLRATMHRLLAFCEERGVPRQQLDELRRLYTGEGGGLGPLLEQLQLRVGSGRELARRCGISAATLWEYRRGHFPLPITMLRKLCQAAGEDPAAAEALWLEVERQRLLDRGYPEALAEFYALLGRAGLCDRDLVRLGLGSAALRRLRYLELPDWSSIQRVIPFLEFKPADLERLRELWTAEEGREQAAQVDGFGPRLQALREARGITRRKLADLFGLGGKKPARTIAAIEEDGLYSAQAFPAGLIALVAGGLPDEPRLIELWRARRARQHLRRRPETRLEIRLARDLYGFRPQDLEAILGYTALQYQRIERGVEPLSDRAQQRILDAILQAGQKRVQVLTRRWAALQERANAWREARGVATLVAGLARREGGFAPLARRLKGASAGGHSKAQLQAIARGATIPAWFVVAEIARACGVHDLHLVRQSWTEQYRRSLERLGIAPLGVEVRRQIALSAASVRAFSARVGVHYSVLSRDLRKLDRGRTISWTHVERILVALGLPPRSLPWQEIHDLWCIANRKAARAVPDRVEGAAARRIGFNRPTRTADRLG